MDPWTLLYAALVILGMTLCVWLWLTCLRLLVSAISRLWAWLETNQQARRHQEGK